MNYKTCTKCLKEFLATNEYFYKSRSGKFGLCAWCKKCKNEYGTNYRKENIEKIKIQTRKYQQKDHVKRYQKQYYKQNKDKIDKYRKEYEIENREKILKRKRKKYKIDSEKPKCKEKRRKKWQKYYSNNKSEYNKKKAKYRRERYKENPNLRVLENLRGRLKTFVKGKGKSASTKELLGCCSKEIFTFFIENQFYPHPTTGEMMTWENYGYNGWHIDHIIPCSSFDFINDPKAQYICFHISNLQPLWAEENLKKRNKI